MQILIYDVCQHNLNLYQILGLKVGNQFLIRRCSKILEIFVCIFAAEAEQQKRKTILLQ